MMRMRQRAGVKMLSGENGGRGVGVGCGEGIAVAFWAKARSVPVAAGVAAKATSGGPASRETAPEAGAVGGWRLGPESADRAGD